jgi:Flp pilus assembly protein TadG
MIIMPCKTASRRGSTLVEFALVSFQLLLVIFAAFEFGRMILVYTSVANSARIGLRYAIVHGNTSTASGVDGPSGPGANPTNILNVVKDYAKVGLLDLSKLTVTVSYPDTTNAPGSRVTVTTVYAYDPWVLLPLHIPLGTTSQGAITF